VEAVLRCSGGGEVQVVLAGLGEAFAALQLGAALAGAAGRRLVLVPRPLARLEEPALVTLGGRPCAVVAPVTPDTVDAVVEEAKAILCGGGS
jgi:hypothetical protein